MENFTFLNNSNYSSPIEEEEVEQGSSVKKLITALKIILIIITLLLNGTILFINFFIIKKSTYSNLLYISNCIVDFFNASFSIPISITSDHDGFDMGKFMCVIWNITDW